MLKGNITKSGGSRPEGHYQPPGEIFDNLPVAIYTCDHVGYITSYNQAAVKLWGRAPQIGRDLWCGSWKIFSIDGTPISLDDCPMARTLKTGIAIAGEEIIVQRPDGQQVPVRVFPTPVFDGKGIMTGASNTLIDLTEQKSSDGEKTRWASIIESSEVAIVSKTLDGIITSWNKAAEHLFGYMAEEIIGKPVLLLFPEDRLEEEVEILGKICNGEKVEHYETYRLTKTGVEIPVSLTISPIHDARGRVIGASKIVLDISKQKTYEEKLQRYTENLEIRNTIGKVISESLDIEAILQQVTDVTTQVTGAAFGAFFYNKLDEHGESYMLFTLSGAPREAFEQFGMPRNTAVFHPTFSGDEIVRMDDITKDPRYGKNHPHYGVPKGHLPVVSYLAVPVISKSGAVIGGLFYGHPEPAKFTLEHENLVAAVAIQAGIALDNAKLYEEVQKLNSKKDEFIGLASHELKTPVTSLTGYLQIISRRLSEGDVNKPFIDRAIHQVRKLSGLISDLLDVSKIETGQLPLSPTAFDLKFLVQEVIELQQYGTKSHRIVFQSDLDVLMVTADRQRLEQVIINLLSNAIKYSPVADQVNVSLSKIQGKAVLSVQDFGMGIAAEQLEHVFSRFYRVEDMAAHISGLGIGLFISREIINRHQGRLWVESQQEKGSVFHFEIPLGLPV
ncbi:MAG: domain S-box protein [Mucilaginibacter sp.]|uniref:PAS domain-containing sensor histidine kinase n=1 Tax=Mucilaginibacter sp. TaxID=1882438 RepID=UPI00262EAAF6|nr:PAS domain S-box protein [Mucilaginibacter sp.]MDB5005159.1 domain S-box protein [Mucilaginibacter sp.]